MRASLSSSPRLVFALPLALSGCIFLSFPSDLEVREAGAPEASVEASTNVPEGGAEPVPTSCEVRDRPFGPAIPLPGSPGDGWVGRLSDDELAIFYYVFEDGGAGNVYTATRSAPDAAFGAPNVVSAVNTKWDERHPFLGDHGRALLFASNRGNANNYELYLSTRADTTSAFGAPVLLLGTSTPNLELTPSLASDGTLFYTSGAGAGFDLMQAPPSVDGGFGPATPITEVNGPSAEFYPLSSNDGLTLYFASNRSGGLDIYRARRTSRGAKYSITEIATDLTSGDDDIPGWISPDGCRMYLTRAPPNCWNNGSQCLVFFYMATRTP